MSTEDFEHVEQLEEDQQKEKVQINKKKRPIVKKRPAHTTKNSKDNLPKEPRLTLEKQNVFHAVEQEHNSINDISHAIWRVAETGGNEFHSSAMIVEYLKNKGFHLTEHAEEFETGFRLYAGKEGDDSHLCHPNIAFLCEYNAEPDTGHSHGHNLVTATCLAAAIGLQRAIALSRTTMGMVTVVGCPSDASKTLKKRMLDAGCFEGIDFLITAYPAQLTCLQPSFLASKRVQVMFRGRSFREGVHNSWEMANPVNAVVMAQQNVAALRGSFSPYWTINGVIPDAGKDPCQIPEKACCVFQLKSPTQQGIDVMSDKLHQCIEGAATASGCKYEETVLGIPHVPNICCSKYQQVYRKNAELNGFTFHDERRHFTDEADDLSFISQIIPTFKLYYYAGFSAKPGTDEFNRLAGLPEAEYMNTVQGKSLAMMAVDLMTDEGLQEEIFTEHCDLLTVLQGNDQTA